MDDFALDRDSSALNGLLQDLRPGTSQMLSDHLDEQTVEHEMAASVRTLMLSAQKELLIINAYVIPDDGLLEIFRTLHERGVSVRILTNSLATEDVAAVNSHYKSWRRRLLAAGVDLHELRADAAVKSTLVGTPPTKSQHIGLHTKCLSVDRQSIFVGSMNLDPRSKSLNTEMGVTIHSPVLAQELASFTEQMLLPVNSWQLAVDAQGDLTWSDDKESVRRQPAQGTWQRVEDEFFMMLPSSLY